MKKLSLSVLLLASTSVAHGARPHEQEMHSSGKVSYPSVNNPLQPLTTNRDSALPDTSFGSLGAYRGLQLLPSLDEKWTPGAFSDLKPRLGIFAQSVGPVVLTNAFSDPASQLGSTLKFAHEMVAIERSDNTILIVNSLGMPIALFDLRLGGRQTFPSKDEHYASVSASGIDIEFLDGTKTSFTRLPFSNYRGENISLFQKLVSPAGKEISIDFTVSAATKLATYTRIDRISVTGSAQSGRITFQHVDIPALRATFTYKGGVLVSMLGTADEVMKSFTLTNGLISQIVDKYGYKHSVTFAGGKLTGECNHNGACVSYTYGTDTVSQKANTENYTSTSTFDVSTGLLTRTAYAGWEKRYSYEPSRTPTGWRISSASTTSKSGVNHSTSFTYDRRERVTQVVDSTGSATTYQYDDSNPRAADAPIAITSTLAGNTVQKLQFRYTSDGLLQELKNLLVSPSSRGGSVRYAYNSKRQIESIHYGDGSVSVLKYENSTFPDAATTQLINDQGFRVDLNGSGQPNQITSVPAAITTSIQYSAGGLPNMIATNMSNLGTSATWSGTYAAGWLLGGETLQETAQGVAATTYKASYKWDPKYRSVVQRSLDNSGRKVGLSEDGGTIPLRSSVPSSTLAETTTTTSPIPGVAPDASGCSPCACLPEYDSATGASVMNGSEACSLVQFEGPPAK